MFARLVGRKFLFLRRSVNLPKCMQRYLPPRSVLGLSVALSARRKATFSDKNIQREISASFSGVAHSTEPTFGPKKLRAFDHDAPLIEAWHDVTPIAWSSRSDDGQWVYVRWSNFETQKYPAIWLRDNCRCDKCYNSVTHTRNTFITDEAFKTQVHETSVENDGQTLSVLWSNGHLSDFPSNWLRGNRFDQTEPDPIEGVDPVLWGSDVMETPHFRMYNFDDVMANDDSLYGWLEMLYKLGIGVLKNAPCEEGQQRLLQNRLGYETATPSSSGTFNTVKLNRKSYHPAYTSEGLQLHNDMTYYNHARGLQIFHCISQAIEGGESLLTDGFKVAEELRRKKPSAFDILTRVPWEFKLFLDKNYHAANRPTIRLDERGNVCQITVNDITRASILRVPVADVMEAYNALTEFNKLLYHPSNLVQYGMEAGDILAFNNFRILHGRLGFTMKPGSVRHLHNCYSDWEIVSARMRTLRKQRLLSNLEN